MQPRSLLSLLALLLILPAYALAEGAGTIGANPNPCTIAPGKNTCTAYITWTTKGIAKVRVYVLDAQRKKGPEEQEFANSLDCAGQKCSAPWIEKGTEYVFTLYDYSSGSRGATLSSVTVKAQ